LQIEELRPRSAFVDNAIDLSALPGLKIKTWRNSAFAWLLPQAAPRLCSVARRNRTRGGNRNALAQPLPISAVAAPPVSAPDKAAGERGYVTVMFCDLIGSATMSAPLAAEAWRDLVAPISMQLRQQ